MFDWTTQKCDENDIPDQAAKAFRNSAGQVVLIDSHFTVRRYLGASLATAAHNCGVLMSSGNNADPSMFDDKSWLGTTWTEDGSTVHGLVHSEYQGYNHTADGFCIRASETFAEKQQCWYNTLTLAKSINGGQTFTHAAPPTHFVAGPAYQYARGIGPIGFFQPSNIVRAKDNFLYILAHVQDYGTQPVGSCLMRTNAIDSPTSWRMWDGTGFTRRSVDPYRTPGLNPADHVCVPVSAHVGTISESLTWNTYFKKWLLVGAWQGQGAAPFPNSGFYYYTSDDLVNWSQPKLLMRGRLPWTHRCSDGAEQIRDPSVLDPDSESRNFDTTGQRAFLYFTRFNVNVISPTNCPTSLDRDLIRIPIEFTNRLPGGPTLESLTASPSAPAVGNTVQFTVNNPSDPDGTITAYKWDLDGDGSYELDTGTSPRASRQYNANEKLTVTVRACDNDGKATDRTLVLNVGTAPLQEPPPQRGAGSTGGDCPAPTGGGGGGSAGGTGTGSGSTPAPPAKTATKPIGVFKLVGKPVSKSDGSIVLRVNVPAAGVLTGRGVGSRTPIRPARVNTKKAGTVKITLRLSKAGKRLLRKKRRAKAKATLVFTPVGGKAQKSTRTITLRRARAR